MNSNYNRRDFIKVSTSFGTFLLAQSLLPSYAWAQKPGRNQATLSGEVIDITIGEVPITFNGKKGTAIAMNGSIPGPAIWLKEGQDVTIRVKNTLEETTSIHWHGLILPPEMDGVPGVSFAGIKPGETFVYKFPVVQNGTYWCHSHSGGQELKGVYAPFIIDPKDKDPVQFDREYIVLLSDWSFLEPTEIIEKLKAQSTYFNYERQTTPDFVSDIKSMGFMAAVKNRSQWMKMRMDPTDIQDVTGSTFTYLTNGKDPDSNWTGLFKKGERIRLRFINGASMTVFDVRIPGLKMKVVQADGIHVSPVEVDEFRFGPGETYDVVVNPQEEKPYAVFSEAMDRSGFAFGTLTPKEGMIAEKPERRKRPLRSMDDMGMSMENMSMPGHDMSTMSEPKEQVKKAEDMSTMDHSKMQMAPMDHSKMKMPTAKAEAKKDSMDHSAHTMPKEVTKTKDTEMKDLTKPVKHGPDTHGPGNSSVPEETRSRLNEPGTGFENSKHKVLVYTDLKSLTKNSDLRKPTREIELHLTGNMDRYMWSINGKKYSETPEPIIFKYGERLRLTLVNDTMMEHPMHLHGMFMDLENGQGEYLPQKHTVLVKPAERVSLAITADAPGDWAFHCHMLFHMELGMFRVVRVEKGVK